MTPLLRSLREQGYAVANPCSLSDFESLAHSLGQEILRTDVRIKSNPLALVVSSEPIEWHQDSTCARWMMWYCVEPGENGETTDVLSLEQMMKSYSFEQKSAFKKVTVLDRLASGQEVSRALYDGESFYYCPWLVQNSNSTSARLMFEDLREKLKQAAPSYSHGWEQGQVLIIDNHRVLHRRPALRAQSRRHLVRLWIAEELKK